jgi:predicted amidophosphoribosyltransferase
MFIGVSNLKGLIVNLGSFPGTATAKWAAISQLLPCAFLAREIDPWQRLVDTAAASSTFVEEKSPFFVLPLLIDRAARSLGLKYHQAAYVTGNPSEIEFASLQPTGTVLVSDRIECEHIGRLPDFVVDDVAEIASIVNGTNRGYFGEVCSACAGGSFSPSSGVIIDFDVEYTGSGRGAVRGGASGRGAVRGGASGRDGIGGEDGDKVFRVFSLGRYFSTAHVKYAAHQFSHRILRSKFDWSQNSFFAALLVSALDFLNQGPEKIDCVISVPPRPGTGDRLLPIVTAACQGRPCLNLSRALVCRKSYPPQIGLDSDARLANVRGNFAVLDDALDEIEGKNVVLFDDIFTTGATLKECAGQLRLAGAGSVAALVLAVSQLHPL